MARFERSEEHYVLKAQTPNGTAVVPLPTSEEATVESRGVKTVGNPTAALLKADGSVIERVDVNASVKAQERKE